MAHCLQSFLGLTRNCALERIRSSMCLSQVRIGQVCTQSLGCLLITPLPTALHSFE